MDNNNLVYTDNNNRITKPDAFGRIFVICQGEVIIEYKQGHYITYNTDHMGSDYSNKLIDKQYQDALSYLSAEYYTDNLLAYSNKTDFTRLYCLIRDEVSCLISQNTTEYSAKLKEFILAEALLYSQNGFGGILATNYTANHKLEN